MTSQEERARDLCNCGLVKGEGEHHPFCLFKAPERGGQEEQARVILMRLLPDHMGYAPIGSPAGTGYALAAMLALAAEVREDAAKVAETLEADGEYPRFPGMRIAAAIRAQGGGR